MRIVTIPVTEAEAAYRRIEGLLAAEWALIEAGGDEALIKAHGALHYGLKALADKYEITPTGPITEAGGQGKPPR